MADIQLTITVPEAYQQRVVDAFSFAAGKPLKIASADNAMEFADAWHFTIDTQQESETLIEFGERFVKELGVAIIRLVDLWEDCQRYNEDINAIDPPIQDVPDDILA